MFTVPKKSSFVVLVMLYVPFDLSSFRLFGKLRLVMSHLSTALKVRHSNCGGLWSV